MTTDSVHTDPQPAPPPVRRLTRSRTDRKVAGVCGGFAAYAGIDANVVRILMVASTLFGFAGPLVYLVAWIIVPEEDAA